MSQITDSASHDMGSNCFRIREEICLASHQRSKVDITQVSLRNVYIQNGDANYCGVFIIYVTSGILGQD